MSVLISDGIANGLADDCPVCHNNSVVLCSGRLTCWGFMDGLTKCVYKADKTATNRYRFSLPKDIADADWLVEWRDKHRVSAQTHNTKG